MLNKREGERPSYLETGEVGLSSLKETRLRTQDIQVWAVSSNIQPGLLTNSNFEYEGYIILKLD